MLVTRTTQALYREVIHFIRRDNRQLVHPVLNSLYQQGRCLPPTAPTRRMYKTCLSYADDPSMVLVLKTQPVEVHQQAKTQLLREQIQWFQTDLLSH